MSRSAALRLLALFLSCAFFPLAPLPAQPPDSQILAATADSLRQIADSLRVAWNFDEAIRLYNQVTPLYEQIGDFTKYGRTLIVQGMTYTFQADYPKALDAYSRAQEALERFPSPRSWASFVLIGDEQ